MFLPPVFEERACRTPPLARKVEARRGHLFLPLRGGPAPIPKEWATVRFDFCPGPLYEKPLRETGGTLVIEQNGIKRIDPETVDAKRICGYKLDELVIVLQAYSVILQGFGVLMNGLDAFQDAAIRWFDGVKDECSYNPQANLDCILRGFTITIPFNDFLFGEGGFSNIANLIPGVNLDSGGS